MCAEICGNRDALDDHIANALSVLAEDIVDNVVEFSCLYAKHRKSDTLEKQDITFAVQKLYPEISKEYKEKDIQNMISQQVAINHPLSSFQGASHHNIIANMVPDGFGNQNINQQIQGFSYGQNSGNAIGVGGQISTMNFRNQMMNVKSFQEKSMALSNVIENLDHYV